MLRSHATLSREQLCKTLAAKEPENGERSRGYALVNVLSREHFLREHIPGSINVARDELGQLEELFDKEKTIVVYGSTRARGESRKVAQDLVQRGFEHVFDYEGGMSDWKRARNPVEGLGHPRGLRSEERDPLGEVSPGSSPRPW